MMEETVGKFKNRMVLIRKKHGFLMSYGHKEGK